MLSAARLTEIGYAIAIFPAAGFLAVAQALHETYTYLDAHGSTAGSDQPRYPFADMNELMGFPEVWAFDEKYGDK